MVLTPLAPILITIAMTIIATTNISVILPDIPTRTNLVAWMRKCFTERRINALY